MKRTRSWGASYGRPRKVFLPRDRNGYLLHSVNLLSEPTIQERSRRLNIQNAPESAAIYVMLAEEWSVLKVGRSVNVAKRLLAVQNGSPVPLVVAFCARAPERDIIRLEGEVHRRMRRKFSRMMGEWYAATVDDAACMIRAVARESEIELSPDVQYYFPDELDTH